MPAVLQNTALSAELYPRSSPFLALKVIRVHMRFLADTPQNPMAVLPGRKLHPAPGQRRRRRWEIPCSRSCNNIGFCLT